MNDKTKIGSQIVQSALIIGISGDILLQKIPFGLNAFVWIQLISLGMIAITFKHRKSLWTKQTAMLYAALTFFSVTFLYRASPELLFFNVVAIFTIWAVLVLPNLKLEPETSGVSHYFLGFVWSGINLIVSPFLLVFNDINWKSSDQNSFSKTLIPIFRGLLIATPLLVIFGGLFMAADASFEGFIVRTFKINPAEIFQHLFRFVFLYWIVAGYFRACFVDNLIPSELLNRNSAKTTETINSKAKFDWRNFNSSVLPTSLRLGTIEICIIFGTLNLLFLSFVIVQLPYLFGGIEYLQTSGTMKLADYARRGFGELVFVSILVLPLLLLGHWFLRQENRTTKTIFQTLAGIQIALVFVIMLSSANRMILYTGNLGYGLTLERLYPMVLMIALAAIFIWFAATVLSGNREKFAWGALWISLFTLGTLNIINPEDFVLRTNFNLSREGRKFDRYYNFGQLNEDAIPTMIELIPSLPSRERCDVENTLRSKLNMVKEIRGLRNWNYSRSKAKRILQNYAQSLDWTDSFSYRDCDALFPSYEKTKD